LGLEFLKLGEDSAKDIGRAVDKIAVAAARDGKQHDATIAIGAASTGFTIHCNDFPALVAAPKLKRHCEIRKYSQKAATWFGVAIRPNNAALRFGLMLDYPWESDEGMEKIVAAMPKGISPADFKKFAGSKKTTSKKVGRNEPCPCGSGLKYKKMLPSR
jgi:hypothetical protein